ncbi:MAG: hypothetical protein A2Y40_04970 [Candidatus Margulisbacteria bacterium GWF2_35_9]|nr:MAG: hypothetical protein A2Y40_04970 [Candidatus Margulisbacteria bacterium GWF2_35_9]
MNTSKKVLIIKNIRREGPGLILDVLKKRHLGYTLVDLSLNDPIPKLSNYCAIFILGGPDSVNDSTKKIQTLLATIKTALDLNIAILGICLGLQALVKAAGGSVIKCVIKEIGFKDVNNDSFQINLTNDGKVDPLLNKIDFPSNVFQLHGETVKLSSSMKQLADSKYCKNQIVKVRKNAYGIQCHFELTKDMLSLWCDEDTDLKRLNKESLINDFECISIYYTKTGIQLITNFLDILKV